MLRKKVITLIVFFTALSPALLAQSDAEAIEILSKVSENYKELNGFSGLFEYSYSTEDEGLIQTNTGNVTVKGERYRLTLNDQEIFNNGKTVWTLIKSSKYKEVTINDVDEDEDELTPSNVYNIYQRGYISKLVGSSEINGVPAHEILLTSEKPKARFEKVKLYVGKSKNEILAWEINDDVGGTFKYTFKELDTDVSIPEDYFEFKVSENQDVEVIDLR
jgi:outer membrane lipoprotein-sorting protein